MSYRVFARKYRPQKFSELVGQDPITQTLQNAISTNRLAQAYLFVGPRGVGKTSTARIFAKALNCFQGTTIDPCGTCDACLEIAEGRNLDVLEIDGASNNSVESIRTLRENAAFSPVRGPYKIYLIDEVHMLTTAAFNALLKTLEEPPAHVKFLFATTEAQKLPATIISRCQRFDLHRISEALIAKHLLDIAKKEEISLHPDAAEALARGADGALRDAESMFDQIISFCGTSITASDVQHVFGFTPSEIIRQLAAAIFQHDTATALTLIAAQAEAGKDLARLLSDFIGFVRDLLIQKVHPSSSDPFFAQLNTLVSTEKLLTVLEELGTSEGRLRWATNKKLQLDITMIKMIHLLQEVSLDTVLQSLTALRQGKPLPPTERKELLSSPLVIAPPALPTPPLLSKELPVSVPPVEVSPPSSGTPLNELSSSKAKLLSSPPSVPAVPMVLPEIAPSLTAISVATAPPFIEENTAPLTTSLTLSDPWSDVAKILASESRLKYGWVELGKFVERQGNKVTVEFPPSCELQTETLFWPQARKKIQECLSKNLGTPTELIAQFTGIEPPEEAPGEPSFEELPAPPLSKPTPKAATVKTEETSLPTTNASPVLTPEALESFKKDPLIQQALEIFRAEILMP